MTDDTTAAMPAAIPDRSGDPEPDDSGPAPIQFFFEFSSPYSYFAAHRIDDMARLYDRTVEWRPILLGPLFKNSGNKPLTEQPLKGIYSKHDMARCARFFGLTFDFPDPFPFPAVAAARAVWWLKDQGEEERAHKLALSLFDAAYADGRDIRTDEVVVALASDLGVDAHALSTALGDQAVKDRLRDEIERAVEAGVCGAPFFIVDDEPFWGADRLDHVERWLATGGW
jgi:2-hydroxychromene-2-carboxylate isomerase